MNRISVMRAALVVVALFAFACPVSQYKLTVQKAGSGAGTITATGIACGSDCDETFDVDTTVTLTAVPESGSTFASWVGCDSTSGATCTVAMRNDRSVTATFELGGGETYVLTVAKTGDGSGTITATGIDCGSDCTESYASGTTVTLTAAADPGSTFSSFVGCDTTSATSCTVTMNAAHTVTASFQAMASTEVADDITVPTTWATGSIYHVTRTIDVTARLTIQAGVVVKLDPGVYINVTTGSIVADGQSPTTPVVFTSAASTPAPGDWGGIVIRAAGSTFANCQILYAGADDRAALEITSDVSASVTHCTFAHHRPPTDAITSAPALDASEAGAATVISDNLFFDDRVPLAVSTKFSPGPQVFDNAVAAPSNPQPSQYNGLVINGCGHVTGNITWPAQTVPYVIGNPNTACNYVTIDAAGRLAIGTAQAEAVVKLFGGGELDVRGTLTPHATFTSIKDDRLGDTNGDGANTTPAGGDWDGISVHQSGSTFDGVKFFYAGGNGRSSLEIRADVAATIRNCTFAHSRPEDHSIRTAPALDVSEAAAATIVTGNTFFDNTVPLAVNTVYSLDDSNEFSGAETGSPVGNEYQGVVVRGCGQVPRSLTWALVKVPLVIGDPTTACNYVNVNSGAQLTIAEGAVLKFFGGGSLVVNGTLNANAVNQITFTAFKDDAMGGDTNADGAATAAAAGEWGGVRLNASGSVLNKVAFRFGGGAADGDDTSAIYVAGDKSATITNCTFAHFRTATDSIRAPATVDLSDASPIGMVFTGNRIYDTTIPLGINVRLSLDDSNRFESGAPSLPMPSRYQGIVVAGCGQVSSNTRWDVTQVPLVIGDPQTACNYLNVNNGGHLTFGPNVVLKFFLEGNIQVYNGGILTIDPTDWLTSYKDDHLTDTNADGTDTMPAEGDWYGIKYHHSGSDPTCDASAYMHYHTPNAGDGTCSW